MANRVVMKHAMKENLFITDLVDERILLLMTHDTLSASAWAPGTPLGAQLDHLVLIMPSTAASAPHKRGRPRTLSARPVSLAVLRGLSSPWSLAKISRAPTSCSPLPHRELSRPITSSNHSSPNFTAPYISRFGSPVAEILP